MMRSRDLGNGLLLLALLSFVFAGAVACRWQGSERRGVEVVAPARASTLRDAIDEKKAGGPSLSAEFEVQVDNSRPLKLPLADPKILVKKGARRLTLYSRGEAVRTYPVALGFSPEGDKERQGDGRTPEGTFYVCVKNARSAFYLSLGLSYPNEEDAARGLSDKLITRQQYERIVSAIKKRRTPPWDTRLGGEIFIHGHGSAGDWTWGCVALDNEDIRELYDAVPVGTAVVIEP